MLSKKLQKIIKIGLVALLSAFGLFIIHTIFAIILFSHLADPNAKETVFSQETSMGKFSLIYFSGDPLSNDTWQFYIDDVQIKWKYVDVTDHIDTLTVGDRQLYLIVGHDEKGELSFAIEEQE